ncbi:isoaspartyl peptidase/L-asparaginase family protein [Kiloniella sp.]|uniref:isoaspartyl peptidase/L-asparaginase family protein n=1 Tax=Kiloniella sp. TaxID=1938587 RepID=UPI003B029E78
MLKPFFITICFGSLFLTNFQTQAKEPTEYLQTPSCRDGENFALHIHGGVTYHNRPERDETRKAYIHDLLVRGKAALEQGVSALDVITFTLASMENSGEFNAGRGSIPNQAGYREMDASVMTGHNLEAGAVASVHDVQNPIQAARFIMEETQNVFFVGSSADQFLKGKLAKADFPTSPPSYASVEDLSIKSPPHGTIGAVALDLCGHLAAGTSTGGFGSKIPGRVGDSPVIGAGTYANQDVGVSASGHGEYFIRYAIAYDLSAKIRYRGDNLNQAAQGVIQDLSNAGGTGGVITVDKDGSIASAFNTKGFIRGYIGSRYPEPITASVEN